MNSKAHIALISLYSTDAIGIRYLASFLKDQDFRVSLLFFKELFLASDLMSFPTEREYKLAEDLIQRLSPDLVGISLRSSYFRIASNLTEKIKKVCTSPVIWGGTHPTVAPEQSIQVADMICIGEGEYPLSKLAQSLSASQDNSRINNIWVKQNGQVIKNEVRPLIKDLNRLPFPDYGDEGKHFIENERIENRDPGLQTYNLNIMASRGCPYQCSYCCNSVFNDIYKDKGQVVRRRSVQNVMDEIHSFKGNFPQLRRIDFIDEVFAWDKQWTEEFTDRYKKEVNLPFHCAQHPNMVRDDILEMLVDAGLERVEVGVQSGSERIRRELFERPVSNKKLIQTAQLLKKRKIVPFYDFIVDNPFETDKEKREGLDFLLEIPRPFHLHVFSLIFFPNTVITKRALSEKKITEVQVEGNAEQTFEQMFVTLRYPRPKKDQFWISLFSLASKSFVPKSLIRWLSKRSFLMRHPRPLVFFSDLANTLKLGFIAVKWLFERKPVFSILRQSAKRRTSPII
jgi:radical SAM superfamily enzyme YgiQ (UPF0313 family)